MKQADLTDAVAPSQIGMLSNVTCSYLNCRSCACGFSLPSPLLHSVTVVRQAICVALLAGRLGHHFVADRPGTHIHVVYAVLA